MAGTSGRAAAVATWRELAVDTLSPKRHLCCPFCGGRSCRCRACGLRFSFGSALTCASALHSERPEPLHCRCGARVGAAGLESRETRVPRCKAPPPPRELIEHLRAQTGVAASKRDD
jgi:hypothetical protein